MDYDDYDGYDGYDDCGEDQYDCNDYSYSEEPTETQVFIEKTEIEDFRFYPQIRNNPDGTREVYYGGMFGDNGRGMRTNILESRNYSEGRIRNAEKKAGLDSYYMDADHIEDQSDRDDDVVRDTTWDEVFADD